jgi:hypothetical protein
MLELGPYGSVRGARGNSRPYREPGPNSDLRVAARLLPPCHGHSKCRLGQQGPPAITAHRSATKC